ncbi:sugar phosphate isomerase/epimerase [Neobacillus sp. B4I6]|jgi:sugar phosphate isomerase/epimerase|uniref:sugar phosphate isomerase/epimerase family protein n=1 Tax=Neobacillus sp. B4I6 TaxID=3373925 RepID=UPI003D24DB3E
MVNQVDLLANYWTLAGNVKVWGNMEEESSPHDFRSRVEMAAKVGYTGIGIIYADLVTITNRYGFEGVKSILSDNGIKYFSVEFIVDWFTDGERRRQSDKVRYTLLKAAEKIGVYNIKVGGDMEGTEWPIDLMVESFSALCAEARDVGSRVSLELVPWSNIRDIDTAIKIISGANAPNGGLCLDIWHVARGGIPYDDIRSIPKQLITEVELDDASLEVVGTLFEDTINNRKLCGQGDLRVPEFIAAVKATGYDGPYGIEIVSEDQRKRPLEEAARQSYQTAIEQFQLVSEEL